MLGQRGHLHGVIADAEARNELQAAVPAASVARLTRQPSRTARRSGSMLWRELGNRRRQVLPLDARVFQHFQRGPPKDGLAAA